MQAKKRLRLRELRLREGWTQAELAAEAGVHVTTISHLELGRTEPQPRSLKLVVRALGVRVRDLWEAEEAEDDPPVRFVMPPQSLRAIEPSHAPGLGGEDGR